MASWPSEVQTSAAIVVMGKVPRSGRVKTRFLPTVSPEIAAELYAAFLADVIGAVELCRSSRPSLGSEDSLATLFSCAVEHSAELREVEERLGPRWRVVAQGDGDLGQRMERARKTASARHVVVIGSDIPTIQSSSLTSALSLLEEAERSGERIVVLGPSEDGGYYLIGASVEFTPWVTDMRWSTALVFRETVRAIEAAGFVPRLVPRALDVDTWPDLERAMGWLSGDSQTLKTLVGLAGAGKLPPSTLERFEMLARTGHFK